jgi:YesN/AraC family two-component response regulator
MMNSIEKLISVSKGVSLLYVEDDRMLQQETAQLLKNFFEKIDLAQNGEEGLELFEPGKYEIIITDINMPKVNGVEMVKAIRRKDRHQMIIVISAHDEPHYLIDLINAGVQRFLSKPIDLTELISILNEFCVEHQKRAATLSPVE